MIKLNCHPYNCEMWFTVKIREFYRKRRALTGRVSEVDVLGMVSCTDNRARMVIGVFDNDNSVLVHEISHAAINAFDYMGMDINPHTTEAFAYFIESLHRQCTAYMNSQAL